MYINSNVMSLTAQRALNEAQSAQQTAMERLSTGKRINSAADDAAGLAIAEGFEAQVRGLNQSVKNASQASQLASTAEGALGEVSDILQRIRELTVQAANSTLSTANRTSLKSEINALTEEIDLIASDTEYNGQKLLNGGASSLSFQVGYQATSTVDLTIDSATSSSLGIGTSGGSAADGISFGTITETATFAALETDDLYINGYNAFGAVDNGTITPTINGSAASIALDITTSATSKAYHLALMINENSHIHGVEASATTIVDGQAGGGVTAGDLTLTIGDGNAVTIAATNSMQDLVDTINSSVDVEASINENGGLRLVDDLGRRITIGGTPDIAQVGLENGDHDGFLTLNSVDGSGFTLTAGDTTATGDTNQQNWDDMGLMLGTFGGGDSGNTYEMTGRAIVTGTAISVLDDFTINGVQVGSTDTDIADANLSAGTFRDAINSVSAESGVTATATNEVFLQFVQSGTTTESGMTAADTITINNVQFSGSDLATPATTSSGGTFADIVTKINADAVAAGSDVRAELTDGSTTSGNIRLYSASGANISVASATGEIQSVLRSDGDNTASDDAAVTSITTTAETFTGSLTFSSESGPIVFGVADGSTTVLQDAAETLATVFGVTMTGTGSSTSGASVSGLNVSSATNASASLATVDAAIDAVASMRGDLGALQNRLSHTISNLQTTSENHEASRSLVEDADYATESAALAKSQVLAQASSAMLAQANAAPQLALQLIQ